MSTGQRTSQHEDCGRTEGRRLSEDSSTSTTGSSILVASNRAAGGAVESFQHPEQFYQYSEDASTSEVDFDVYFREQLHSPSSGDEPPKVPVRGGQHSTASTTTNNSSLVAVDVTFSSSYSFSEEDDYYYYDDDDDEENFALGGISLLDQAYSQCERMVERERYHSPVSSSATSQNNQQQTAVPGVASDDDLLSRELQELEQSERSLRQELQILSSGTASMDGNISGDNDNSTQRRNEMAEKVRAASQSLMKGDLPATISSDQQQDEYPSTDHPDIAAGPPAPSSANSSPQHKQQQQQQTIENPFDAFMDEPHSSSSNTAYTNISMKPSSSSSNQQQPDTVSAVSTDISMNTVAFLEKSPPSGRQRVPSDGDEQLTRQPRGDEVNDDDDDDDDRLTTANRGVPLQFDPDTYSYDAEVDAILHHHNLQQQQDQQQSELQDIDERTGSAAYTTTSDDEDSMAGNSGAMMVAPPYLVAPSRSNAYSDEGLRSTSISELSSSGSGSGSSGETSSNNQSSFDSSNATSENDGSNNIQSNRPILAGAVISPAVTALSLAQGSADGDDERKVSLDRSNAGSNNPRADVPLVQSRDAPEGDEDADDEVDANSVSALAASATPLMIGETTATSRDDDEKASVHSFSVGTASSDESRGSDSAQMATAAAAIMAVDEEVATGGIVNQGSTIHENSRLVTSSTAAEKKRQRRERGKCCSGISWSDRFKLVIAVLFWSGLAAMVYFLISWAINNDDKNDGSIPGIGEDDPDRDEGSGPAPAPVATTPIAPPVSFPTAAPTSNADALLNLLVSASFDEGAALRSEGSPQNQAFYWLASNSNVTEYNDSKKLTRYALATFYWSTGGNRTWVDESRWLSDEDECDWFTRSRSTPCNFEGGFQDLEVSYNNLEGVLPPELALLSDSLVTINIGGGPNNAIGGSLPEELGFLSKLEELRLPSNNLTGSLPTAISGWSSIRTINLSGNRLEGPIPKEIGVMTDLYLLAAENNLLSGPIPTTIGNLARLKTLTLSNNQLTGMPTQIGSLRDLVFLEMQENSFIGPLPSEMGELRELRQLKLNNNTFSQTMPQELSLLSSITTIDLSFNSFEGPVPPFGSAVSNQIRNLRLSHNLLSGGVPASFANLTGVQTLLLHNNNLQGDMPTVVCNTFGRTFPTVFVDCEELACPCCSFCCTDGGGCSCQFTNSSDEWQCF